MVVPPASVHVLKPPTTLGPPWVVRSMVAPLMFMNVCPVFSVSIPLAIVPKNVQVAVAPVPFFVHVALEKDPLNVNPPPGPVLLATENNPPGPNVALEVNEPGGLVIVWPVVRATVPLQEGGGQSYPIPRSLTPASVELVRVRSLPPLAVIVPSLFRIDTLVCAEAANDPSRQRASVARKTFARGLVMARPSQPTYDLLPMFLVENLAARSKGVVRLLTWSMKHLQLIHRKCRGSALPGFDQKMNTS